MDTKKLIKAIQLLIKEEVKKEVAKEKALRKSILKELKQSQPKVVEKDPFDVEMFSKLNRKIKRHLQVILL